MNTLSIKTYSLGYADWKSYLFTCLFVIGNLILPQLCHLMPQGGMIWLPIYFFTLIAAYKYGWYVGLLTAIASPLLNHWLFGMPATEMLPVLLIKSSLLATFAAIASKKTKGISLLVLTAVVFSYQIVGTLIEWAIVKDFHIALQDFRLGIPGILFQIIGGYFFLRLTAKY